MNYIEERLDKITENFPEGRKFFRQWEDAKDYMPKVLHSISQYFPHYSLHDESHSDAILNNIIKITGKDVIDKMSVVDLWFLLTSAYYHDVGMYITAEDKNAIVCPGSDFVDYLIREQKEESSPMSEFASLFEIKDNKIFYKNNQLTSQNIDALRFLIADFFRSYHAKRSAEKIESTTSLNLPGNPIPRRLIKLLGKICMAHTQSQEQVLELPQIESSGCGTENCHPLYIACLLRLGDLLDIDTNRVSEVLLSTLPTIPADSIRYNETNRDVTHIRIDKSVIEMTALCKDYEVAILVNNWFNMIDNEISFQTKNWYLIVPDTTYGSLPSTGKMTVELDGYDNFNLKDRPQFKIDNNKAIEMLQGAGLYNDPSQCVRELLQNSVDATYLRVFKENPNISTIDEFRRCCAEDRYQINVNFKKVKVENGVSHWEFTLQDNGLGMSKEDIKYFSRTGSSNQNVAKRKIVEKMPAWMRPSGTFGIGFQSVFLITDEVNMKTRHWGREETIELKMYNPAGKEKGNILLKTSNQEDNAIGTTINFQLTMPAQTGWSVGMNERITISIINDYDFARDESLDVRAAKMMEEIYKFSWHSYPKINLVFKDEIFDLSHNTEDFFDFYDEKTGLQVKLGNDYGNKGLYFRNQCVEKFNLNLPLLRFSINILVGDAKDILTLNRNDVRSEYVQKLRNQILLSTCKYICQKFDTLPDVSIGRNCSLKQYAAAFIEQHKDYIKHHDTQIQQIFPEDWKNIPIYGEGEQNEYTIHQLMDFHHVRTNSQHTLSFYRQDDQACSFMINTGFNNTDYDLFLFLRQIIHTCFTGIQYTANGILINKTPTTQYIEESNETRKKWLRHYLNDGFSHLRGTMPCNEKYKFLEIDGGWSDNTFHSFNFNYPIMVCPYIRKCKERGSFWPKHELDYLLDDKVIDYVYYHRKDKSITKEQIKDVYNLFHEDFKQAENEIAEETKQS